MSITAQDFLQSAEMLAAFDTGEVHQRNALSRVYYAAYHRSCEYIKPDNKDRGVGSHRGYIEQLLESPSGSLARRIGVSLGVVFSGRIRADYKLTETVTPREFSMSLARVKDIFTHIDSSHQQATAQTPNRVLQVLK